MEHKQNTLTNVVNEQKLNYTGFVLRRQAVFCINLGTVIIVVKLI
jgi:hypothetical protein